MLTFFALCFVVSMAAAAVFLLLLIVKAIMRKDTKRTKRCFLLSLACMVVSFLIFGFLPKPEPPTPEECAAAGHKWIEATCTAAKKCDNCGTVEGDPLGHAWKDATCDTPRSCTRCSETDGSALGHAFGEKTVSVEPTCSAEGKAIGSCTRCGKEVTEPVTKIAHVTEWKVTKEAKPAVPGEKSLICTVCGAVTATEKFEMTDDEIKALCQTYKYEDFSRYPDKYKGEYAKFTGEVIQVSENAHKTSTDYVLRVNVTKQAYGIYTDTIYVVYESPSGEGRILYGDVVTMYGQLDGLEEYTSVLMTKITIPRFEAMIIEIQ